MGKLLLDSLAWGLVVGFIVGVIFLAGYGLVSMYLTETRTGNAARFWFYAGTVSFLVAVVWAFKRLNGIQIRGRQ